MSTVPETTENVTESQTRRSLLSRLLALPALLVTGRLAEASAEPKPKSPKLCSWCSPPDADWSGHFKPKTREEARDSYHTANAILIQSIIEQERHQFYPAPLIATEGDMEVEKSYSLHKTADQFIAELVADWHGSDRDMAVWRGERIVAVLEGIEDGKPRVTRFQDVNAEPMYKADEDDLRRLASN